MKNSFGYIPDVSEDIQENLKNHGLVPVYSGPAHLHNEIDSYRCAICKEDDAENMVLLRDQNNNFHFQCTDHPETVQEFLRQFKRPPLGWKIVKSEEDKNEMGIALGADKD